MNILAISDKESPYLWDHYDETRLKGVDLILSCGDLKPEYLSFLVTMSNVPLLYVHGNHDRYEGRRHPDGCICIEDQLYLWNGLRILGLGGSMFYSGGPHQYSQAQMNNRARRLWLTIRRAGGFDILLTHAPAAGLNDGPDVAHQGFSAFTRLLDRYEPAYFIHGHVHMDYNYRQKRTDLYGKTTVINAYERFLLEYDSHS